MIGSVPPNMEWLARWQEYRRIVFLSLKASGQKGFRHNARNGMILLMQNFRTS